MTIMMMARRFVTGACRVNQNNNAFHRIRRTMRGYVITWTGRMGLVMVGLVVSSLAAQAQSGIPDRGYDEMARVNGVVITRRAFQVEYRQAVDQHAREGKPVNEAHIAAVRQSVIQRMVEEELLVQKSRQMGIVVSPEEIETEVAAARARFKDEETFQQELARRYLDETRYRRKLLRQRAVDRVIERLVMPSIAISEDEIRRFYDANPSRYQIPEKVRLSHIMIRLAPGENPEDQTPARLKIEMIKDRLDQGEDFSQLASQYTDEPHREQGGDLGYIQRGQLLPEMEAVAFDLDVGATSPILTTARGFHLIRVTDRTPKKTISLEDARPDIHRSLLQVKRESAVRALIDRLRKQADIRSSQ